MSYVKLFKVTADFALGFQTLNTGLDNNEALFAQIDVRHFTADSRWGPDVAAIGRHDDAVVARGAADYYASSAFGRTEPILAPLLRGRYFTGGAVRLATGKWMLQIQRSNIFSVVATVKSDATGDKTASCYVSMTAGNGSGISQAIISTWNIATPALEDMDFSVVLWGETEQ